jgi:hypothetical protein
VILNVRKEAGIGARWRERGDMRPLDVRYQRLASRKGSECEDELAALYVPTRRKAG